ncbi:hypothetical protein B1207_06605 [Legionella quinlivanii]|uniref:ABC transporter n=1 Tax=Legionella quinlivanii TaxID=45073 RepID=A0A364LKZ2_9GAMM|nr:ATP-binding cassette domain-containing protein [Legionella quinlivanii]RAP37085.1 hypothetical protein B1207_06605 [Legionella quinlivanii]
MTDHNRLDISEILVLLENKEAETAQHDFLTVCAIVANSANIKLKFPAQTGDESKTRFDLLSEIANLSQFRFREIQLPEEWWKYDNGPLLAFTVEGNACALIPTGKGYQLHIPGQEALAIEEKNAAMVLNQAFYFYKPLAGGKIGVKDVLQYIYQQSGSDLKRLLLVQIVLAALALIIPLGTGYLFSVAIPFADTSAVTQVIIAFIINAFITASLQLVEIISLFRIKLKANANIQAAIWDRVLRFPANFFSRFQIGDLSNRISSIDIIQQELTLSLLVSLSNTLVFVFSLILLCYLLPVFSLLLILFLVIASSVSFFITLKQLRFLRGYFHVSGENQSLLLQIFTSINKIRGAHREELILNLWLRKFIEKMTLFFKSSKLTVIDKIINLAFSLFSTFFLYLFVVNMDSSLNLGLFILYNAAFSQLFLAFIGLWNSINQMVRIIPVFERTKPVFQTETENYRKENCKLNLKGSLELRDIQFKYSKNEGAICDDLSFKMEQGEYVGILGKSGVGKSTLLRLLLGFEKPQKGQVLFDDMELCRLNLQHLRSQLGVILQTSALMPGSILSNIIGINSSLTEEDAWRAAQLANIASDIEKMPMGMRTVITDRSGAVSLGQRQRILIARALAKKPRVLILDEAMSGMDDETLSLLKHCVESLSISRLVITHRPEFLSGADTIYIFEKGQLYNAGRFEELCSSQAFNKFRVLKAS